MKLVAKSPGAAAIIGYGDEGGEISEVQEFPGVWKRRGTKRFRPASKAESPVPPPMAKTLRP